MIYTKEELLRMRDEMIEQRAWIDRGLMNTPDGRLMITNRGGRTNYFRNRYDENGRRVRREGITKNRQVISQLAIKSFREEKRKILDRNIEAVDQMLAHYIDVQTEEIVRRMDKKNRRIFDHFYSCNPELLHCSGTKTIQDLPAKIRDLNGDVVNIRKLLDVQMLCLEEDRIRAGVDMAGVSSQSRREIMRAWAATPYNKSTKNPEQLTVVADGGLKVRSRLEALGVEKLNKFDVPFRYEQIIWFDDIETVPDVTILLADGGLLLWEMCGMMELQGYREDHLRKRAVYEKNGFSQWHDNLIMTYAKGNEYNSDVIECIIKNQILPLL